jgi:hypothetical protein
METDHSAFSIKVKKLLLTPLFIKQAASKRMDTEGKRWFAISIRNVC